MIISEWMGYFLLYESMLDSIIEVREKYLKKGGTVFPNKAQIFVAAIDDEKFYSYKVGHWKDVYGFDMSCLSTAVLREAQIDLVDGSQNVVSNDSLILDLDLNTMKKEEVNFASEYSVKINKNCKLHGLVAWFDCIFVDPIVPELAVTLTTSPFKKPTHWK